VSFPKTDAVTLHRKQQTTLPHGNQVNANPLNSTPQMRAERCLIMASPKDNEERMERMQNGWRTLKPEKTFGGMKLADFEAVIKPCRDSRQRIDELDNERRQEVAKREAADANFNDKARLVVAGVLADPEEGPDSALYESFGYTPERERKTGLTRRKFVKEKTEK
jgi:hypothetical protein